MFKTDKLSPEAVARLACNGSPSFSGIIAGECKGDIWVDDLVNPSIALVASAAVGGFSILGEPPHMEAYRQLKDYLVNNMFYELKAKGVNSFEFSIESASARALILELFGSKVINTEMEHSFRRNVKYDTSVFSSDEYQILRADHQFLMQLEAGAFANKEFLAERLLGSWFAYDDFLKQSGAYVALHQNRIIAVIIGTARFENIVPVDIEVESAHRQKGLALALIYQFVNACIDNGITVQWDCVDSNIASLKTVEKASFVPLRQSTVYWFEI